MNKFKCNHYVQSHSSQSVINREKYLVLCLAYISYRDFPRKAFTLPVVLAIDLRLPVHLITMKIWQNVAKIVVKSGELVVNKAVVITGVLVQLNKS